MKNLVRIFFLLIIVGAAIGIHSSCSDENDCSMAGRPMMYCTFKTNSIILNNEKDVHTVMLPLRYTSDSTVFIFQYNPVLNPEDVDTVYIVQESTPYFQSMECGYMMKQNIISAAFGNRKNSTEKITSIELRNKEANSNEIENLQIFFNYRDRTPD